MSIESELSAFLGKAMRSSDLAKRNAEIVAFHYGMRDAPWPTLEQTGQAQAPAITRERVRKLIEWYFKGKAPAEGFPNVRQIALLIEKYAPISSHALLAKLREERLVAGKCSAPGLLNLLHDLGFCRGYSLYNGDQSRVTRNTFAKTTNVYFSDVARISSLADRSSLGDAASSTREDLSNDLA